MKLPPKTETVLKNALITEVQAIAIYQAECFWLSLTPLTRGRRLHLKLCQKILQDELQHQHWVESGLTFNAWDRTLQSLNRMAGWGLGSLFACLPARWNWALHAWAETQAAEAYHQARARLQSPESIRETLQHAAEQELRHHRIFRKAWILSSPRSVRRESH